MFDAWEYEWIDTSNLITTEICYIRWMLEEYNYFGKTRLAGGELPILSLFLSEIITKISGLLIDLLLWVYFVVVDMFPLMSSMIYLFLVLFSHVM